MQTYSDVDLTEHGADEAMRQRDEFNFTTSQQFGTVALDDLSRISPPSPASSTTAPSTPART
ncbi:hypothetical protein [Streptomyces sp. DH12]|uniref:hypothetical protein n=1 Tax=Streptomyces sp. DH12 TaxID=2857010 RepID=UPI001E298C60|nr:hypothetical protein [Streptomyces sp. DH12]